MNTWAKLMTALRGGVSDTGEVLMEAHALRILDQEIREASEALRQSRANLTDMMALRQKAQEKISQIQQDITEAESETVKALEAGDETLAKAAAQKIIESEQVLAQQKEIESGFTRHVAQLRPVVTLAEANIKRLKQQADTVKATETVQRAQVAVAERQNGVNTRLRTALDSLERIKEKQANNAAQIEAAKDLNGLSIAESIRNQRVQTDVKAQKQNIDEVLEKLKKRIS